MKPTRPPRGRKPHLLTRLEALTKKIRALGLEAYGLSNELHCLRCEADRQRNPHNPRTRAERLAKEARRG